MSKLVQRDPKAPIDHLNGLTGSVNPPKYTDRAEHVLFHIWLHVLAAWLDGISHMAMTMGYAPQYMSIVLTMPPSFYLAGKCIRIDCAYSFVGEQRCDNMFLFHITVLLCNSNIHT